MTKGEIGVMFNRRYIDQKEYDIRTQILDNHTIEQMYHLEKIGIIYTLSNGHVCDVVTEKY